MRFVLNLNSDREFMELFIVFLHKEKLENGKHFFLRFWSILNAINNLLEY